MRNSRTMARNRSSRFTEVASAAAASISAIDRLLQEIKTWTSALGPRISLGSHPLARLRFDWSLGLESWAAQLATARQEAEEVRAVCHQARRFDAVPDGHSLDSIQQELSVRVSRWLAVSEDEAAGGRVSRPVRGHVPRSARSWLMDGLPTTETDEPQIADGIFQTIEDDDDISSHLQESIAWAEASDGMSRISSSLAELCQRTSPLHWPFQEAQRLHLLAAALTEAALDQTGIWFGLHVLTQPSGDPTVDSYAPLLIPEIDYLASKAVRAPLLVHSDEALSVNEQSSPADHHEEE